MKDDISKNYSGIDIIPLRFFGPGGSRISAFKELMKSKYIFTCEESALPFKRKWHTHVFLSYFKPFKDDYAYHHISKEEQCNNPLDICVSTSSTYSNIVAHAYDVSFSKFAVLGFSRDDMLLSKYDCPALDKAIKEAVDYEVKHVILYTPTHRDYETNNGTKRDVMGFRMNVERLETYLRTNNILLICKLHTKQNSDVIGSHNIKGLIVHTPSNDFGLCELLQRADVLITDYTSTYFDYLLLDRPVLFNFYDFDKYNATRGFSFDPLSSILAGGIFKDEASFYLTLEKAIGGNDGFKEKRHFVRDLMHKYIDCNSSERICKYVLG